MAILENASGKRAKKTQIQKIILRSIAAVGVLSVALLAPNALQMLKMFGYKPHRRQKEVINASRAKLLEQGFLKRNERGFLQLTSKGEAKLRALETYNYRLPHPKHWDKKWRGLIFDIPEKRKGLRDKVRLTLASIGFRKLQKSVWVYPYDCEDLITLLKADFKIGKDLLYMIVDSIENDGWLRKSYKLPEGNL